MLNYVTLIVYTMQHLSMILFYWPLLLFLKLLLWYNKIIKFLDFNTLAYWSASKRWVKTLENIQSVYGDVWKLLFEEYSIYIQWRNFYCWFDGGYRIFSARGLCFKSWLCAYIFHEYFFPFVLANSTVIYDL